LVLLGILLGACERPSSRAPAPSYPPGPGYPPGTYPPPPQQNQSVANAPPRSNDDIARVINAAYPTFTDCYRHSEAYMTGRSGTVTVFFDIAPQGNVVRATDQAPPGIPPDSAPLNDARLTACLVQHFQRLTFPVARDESAASWLFSFAP
jgi:hypothetical protein